METEKPYGVVVQFGGQTAIKLTKYLDEQGCAHPGHLCRHASTRRRTASGSTSCLERCGIPRPQGHTVFTTEEAVTAANESGLSGAAAAFLRAGRTEHDYRPLRQGRGGVHGHHHQPHDMENPVLIDKYMMGTEVEVDAICDGEDYLIPGIMEHIERAGVHSGDSISVYPAQTLSQHIQAHHHRLHRPAGKSAEGCGACQHPVRRLQQRGLRHRGQPALLPDRALYQQSHRRADGGPRNRDDAWARSSRTWATAPGFIPRGVCGGQGSGVQL